ncbi:hypothetical protein J6590_012384 [Homalodisca vitripennis]|nr:hypothetical protein J6590_012384 [Homalodisca vitripennis]
MNVKDTIHSTHESATTAKRPVPTPPQLFAPDSAPSTTTRTEDDSLRMLYYEEGNSTDDMPLLQKTCHIQQFCATACGAQTNQSEFFPHHFERQIGNRLRNNLESQNLNGPMLRFLLI